MARDWTNHEVKYLHVNYGILPVVEISKYINKSEEAIRQKAHKLGLKSKLPHKQAKHVEEIKFLLCEFYTQTEIAQKLGISRRALSLKLANKKYFDDFDRRLAKNNYKRRANRPT